MDQSADQLSTLSAKQFGSVWAPYRLVIDHGLGLTQMADTAEFDFLHDSSRARLELKASRANAKGELCFQYIRPDSFDVCICMGCDADSRSYWILRAKKLPPLLSRQQRNQEVYKLLITPAKASSFDRYRVQPSRLRTRLDEVAQKARRRAGRVRLDKSLEAVEGWTNVARSVERKLDECGLDWDVVLRPIKSSELFDDPNLLPYPDYFDAEFRMEMVLPPKPVVGSHNVAAWSESIIDFVLQHIDRDFEHDT